MCHVSDLGGKWLIGCYLFSSSIVHSSKFCGYTEMLLYFSFLGASVSEIYKCIQLSVQLQVSVNCLFHKRLFMFLMANFQR